MPSIRSIKYLTQDELRRLLGAIDSKRDKAMFLIAYRHGLRASEVGMLRVEDINTTTGRIRFERLKHSLGGEQPMQPDETKAVKAWLKERTNNTPCLFPSQRGLPISRFTLDKLIKVYGQKAKLPPDKCHFHVLKHSICTHLSEAGADVRFIQDWVGHVKIENTVIYTQITNRAREEQARRFFASPMIVGT